MRGWRRSVCTLAVPAKCLLMVFPKLGLNLLIYNLANYFQKFRALICIPTVSFDAWVCMCLGVFGHKREMCHCFSLRQS